MKRFLLGQLVTQILNLGTQPENLFNESRLVYFAGKGSGKGKGGKEGDDGDEEEKERDDVETGESAEPAEDAEAVAEVSSATAETLEKVHSLVDEWEYDRPPDIDPERIQKVKDILNQTAPRLDAIEESVNGTVDELIQEMDAEPSKELKNSLWQVVYSGVPEYSHEVLKANKKFSEDLVSPNISFKIRKQLQSIWKKYSKKPFNMRTYHKYNKKFLEYIDEIARNEFEMLKTINEVKEVMWDMQEKLQKQHIEQRMLKGAERYTGLPLGLLKSNKDETFELRLKGKGLSMVGVQYNEEKDGEVSPKKPIVDKFDATWIVKDVYVDQERYIDPEDKEIPESEKEKMLMRGVWVMLQDNEGKIYRMPVLRLKDFSFLHNLRPDVNNLDELHEQVTYLDDFGIKIEDGMELEYEEMDRDENNNPIGVPITIKVGIVGDKVTLDKDILYRSKYDSPNIDDHEFKHELTLSEFAKWLIQRRPLPVMDYDELQKRLIAHDVHMNKKFKKRNPDCHRAINLAAGEVLFSDAPGNPLYEIKNVDEQNGIIEMTHGVKFSYPQFLRWVYQYEMEAFDPDLEKEKMKTYKGEDEETSDGMKKRAEDAIDRMRDKGEWRNIFDRMKKDGVEGIAGPKEGSKTIFKTDKENGIQAQSRSFLRDFINKTDFLSVDDVFQLFKSGWEYYERNWQRRQKTRYSNVGKGVPWFGTEFERVNQQSENEEVQQFKDAMDQWGVWQIEDTLHNTGNRDQAKGCLNVLAEKGMIRWDDMKMWKTLNQFTDEVFEIPMPKPGQDPYQKFAQGTKYKGRDIGGRSAMDFLPEAMDSLWGEGSFVEWKRQNDGAIEDGIQKSYNKGEELENDPKNIGGIAKELEILLEKHMNDEYVEPSEYEGLLRFIIEAGKSGGKQKIYFLLMGVSAENSRGKTLMGWERVGRFVSKYGNKFPALDYWSGTNNAPKRDPKTGEIFTRQWNKADFIHLTKPWEDRARSTGDYSPPPEAMKFLLDEVLTSEAYQLRLEKGIRNAQDIDHDDSPFFIPGLKESEIESACATTGGETKKFTVQGYKNAYLGFGMRLDSLTKKYDEEKSFEDRGQTAFKGQYMQKLVASFRSYMKYDSILDDRYRREDKSRMQRLGSHDFKSGCVWDGNHAVQDYRTEMKDLILEITAAYKQSDDAELTVLPFKKLLSTKDNKDLARQQKTIESSIENWGAKFEKMVMKDGGKKMLDLVRKHEFLVEKNVLSADLTEETKLRNKMEMEMFEATRTEEVEEATGALDPTYRDPDREEAAA